jgi:N6-L-threonylcarbamoyladenine synthase
VNQLSELFDNLFLENRHEITAIGVSTKPRNVDGSYMPCFMVGNMAANILASVSGVQKHEFSHQEGHVVAALYSLNRLDLLKREFYAFHVSGGTTELLSVTPHDEKNMDIKLIARSLDLKAGQAVDRVGAILGLPFPSGPRLEQLALLCEEKIVAKPSMKNLDCCLSGVENQCKKLKESGAEGSYIARFCIENIKSAIDSMTQGILNLYGEKPIVYAGGVMSNSIIKEFISKKYNGLFAEPVYSSDNAAGIALLASIKHNEN